MGSAWPKGIRWQGIAGAFSGTVVAGYLTRFMEEPSAYFLGGILWATIMLPVTPFRNLKQRVVFILSMGCGFGFAYWFMTTYF